MGPVTRLKWSSHEHNQKIPFTKRQKYTFTETETSVVWMDGIALGTGGSFYPAHEYRVNFSSEQGGGKERTTTTGIHL